MNDYSHLDDGKEWIEEHILDIQTEKEIEIGKWCNPDEWGNSESFGRGDVGLEVFIDQERDVLVFNKNDIDDAPKTPEIRQKIVKYIQQKLS